MGSIIGIIVCTIILLSLIGLLVYFIKVDEDNTLKGAVIFLIIAPFLTLLYSIYAYTLPHHGDSPSLSDVAINEAHIDTIYTINKNDTIIDYQINWND